MALVPQREQLASTPSRFCQKEKEQSRLPRVPNHDRESQGEREPHLDKREVEREHREERVGSTVKKGRFQVGEEVQARRASLGDFF